MRTEVLVVGAGPAGITAAIQLKRSGIDTIIIEKDRVGGALLNAGWVENYPGFADGITGVDLVKLFQHHIDNVGVEIHHLEIERLTCDGDYYLALCSGGEEVRSKAVIIATGSTPNRLNVPGEIELEGRLVFHELRDLPENFGLNACIIGGGDAALLSTMRYH